MNLRDLSYLRALARTGHFGQAAAACHVSQPTLSVQLKKLEEELGVVLIERSNRAARLTDIGQEVLDLARQALDSVDAIRTVTTEARDPFSGRFTFGSIPTISPYVVPSAVSEITKAFPRLQLGFRENITEQLNEDLLRGEIDAAILATPTESPRLTCIPLYNDALRVIFPTGHNLAGLKRLDVKDLPLDQIILLSEGHCFRDQAVDLCHLSGSGLMRETSVTSLETIVSLVAAGQGISIVPDMAYRTGRLDRPDIGVAPLDSPNAHRGINLTFRRTAPRRQLLESVAKTLQAVQPGLVKSADA